jgi:hypothetical protein
MRTDSLGKAAEMVSRVWARASDGMAGRQISSVAEADAGVEAGEGAVSRVGSSWVRVGGIGGVRY